MSMGDGDQRVAVWDATFEAMLRVYLPYGGEGPLGADDVLADLGLDSMSVVSLLVDLEAGYGIEFPDELLTAETFDTVGSLWTALSGVTGVRVDDA
jgi:acyl carrier protein